ncbi:MAG: helix-turn-helix transcriptional regulator [Polyangiaceae bacterium]|nr:helix-turn-helix transcriptional regulator [Polyangiaceae bacterium]
MQEPRAPPDSDLETRPYPSGVARSAAASKGPRPAQGARLLALRRAAGLTQVELAKALGVSNANIAFWEWSAKPPRSDVLPALARALRVRVEDLLLEQAVARTPPNSKLQRTFEKVRSLPRRHQDLVARFVDTLLEQHKKAS